MSVRPFLHVAACLLFCASVSAQNFVCALSEKQEHDAPVAFAKLMPLFLTPRCFNCHGGVNPFVRATRGTLVQDVKPRGTHPGLDKNDGTVIKDKDGNEDFDATFAGCDSCHNVGFGKSKWRLAPAPEMQFGPGGVARSALELCEQVKIQGRKPGAVGFIGHMTNDNGDATAPFLATAFGGKMALDPDQVDGAINDLRNEGGYPAPITVMTQPEAVQFAKDWVGHMGGKFRLPDDCGCKEHQYALRVIASGSAQMNGMSWNLRFEGQGTSFPEIPLKFKDNGTLSGEVMAVPVEDNQGAFPLMSCAGERKDLIKVELQGAWKDITPASTAPTSDPPSAPKNPIQVRLIFSEVQTNVTETCSTIFGTMSGSGNKTGPMEYPFDLIFPKAEVDEVAITDWHVPFPSWTGTVRAKIIEVSSGP